MAERKISNCIRNLRFNHGEMTQQELATRVGVTRQTIVALEKELYSPSLELAFRIARVFNQTIDSVFSYRDDQNGPVEPGNPAGK